MSPLPASATLAVLLPRVLIPFAAGYFLSYLFRTVNAVIAPDLTHEMALSAADLGLLTSAYFLAFAFTQLPLGLLLDRYGARRVEACMLMIAAAGGLVFALAESVLGLMAGRTLIGLGASACLMGAFKANVVWFPRERLPLVNGLTLAAGGIGAVAATAPVELALQFTDWRGVFLWLSALTVASAVLILLAVPERPSEGQSAGLRAQMDGIRQIFSSATFWQIAPVTMVQQAGFLAIQSLWAGPWLRDVAGLDRPAVANYLLAFSLSMVAGFLLNGMIAERLGRLGIKPATTAAVGMTIFLVCLLFVTLGWTAFLLPLWLLFGYFGTTGTLPYALLSQSFPAHLAGRVNTALNLVVFIGAFAAQWGMGAIINLFPTEDGYAPAGYTTAFGVMVVLEVLTLVWLVMALRRQPRNIISNKPI
ncbi:MFS transporter [Telmatospirillum sp. J64-1]|uniref:MFS transporter n=1 Tax=Telmatospirillum sp. J64-1 TaxID=2502183 RepID=UPI00115CD644|nr:MFS transporter [Telmatospirillum sp. J64-1]